MATPIPGNQAQFSTWSAAAATCGTIAKMVANGAMAVGITSDSRAVKRGCAFVALRGKSHDGHSFIAQAVEAGAPLVVAERGCIPRGLAADIVEVDDTLLAWGALARAHVRAWRRARFGQKPAVVVAITGTAGKTTTKDLCAALLETVGPCLKTTGNLNNRIGLPAVAFGLDPEHQFAVLELGMSMPGEIAELARIIEPDVGVITNVGLAHAEGVGGKAGVVQEKGALFEALGVNATAIVNADDGAACGQLARSQARRVASFGNGPGATYRIVERKGVSPTHLSVDRPSVQAGKRERISVPYFIAGDAAAKNFVAALAAAEVASGTSLREGAISSQLAEFVPSPGRLALLRLNDGTLLIDDSYNANPTSMRAALEVLDELASSENRHQVAILGEMKELGELTTQEHVTLGHELARAKLRLLISCGGAMHRALDALKGSETVIIAANGVEDAVRAALAEIRPDDVVLVKASRSVGTEKVADALVRSRGKKTLENRH